MARKRKTNPGVRVVGGRISDSRNGKSCHQCRQKTMDFVAPCKVMKKKNKLCPIKFCYKCLSNRYGENAEEVAKMDDWIYPQCRGICTCSVCRVSQGLHPTGILVHKAKACGLASVSELLKVEGPDKFAYLRKPKLTDASNEGSSGNSESVPGKEVEIFDVAKEKKKVVGKRKKAKSSYSYEFPLETFVGGVAAYEKMNASRRLKLLNFLCDESLSTWAIRNYIKSQTEECEKQKKKLNKRLQPQRKMYFLKSEKQLKQKMQGDVAKAIMEKNGAPLSIEEHNLVMSQIAEAKEAHEKMMEAMISGMMRICDARRTEPIMLDDNGLVIWKMKCYEEEPIFLLQDLGTFDDLYPHEGWLAFKTEQKPEIENYILNKR